MAAGGAQGVGFLRCVGGWAGPGVLASFLPSAVRGRGGARRGRAGGLAGGRWQGCSRRGGWRSKRRGGGRGCMWRGVWKVPLPTPTPTPLLTDPPTPWPPHPTPSAPTPAPLGACLLQAHRTHPPTHFPPFSRTPPLQAHDFEAYQEMLRKQAGISGAASGGERYEAISKFLQGGWVGVGGRAGGRAGPLGAAWCSRSVRCVLCCATRPSPVSCRGGGGGSKLKGTSGASGSQNRNPADLTRR